MDTRVELAVAHWGPRFVTNGVTLSDFERITSSIDVWDDWCSAWCSAAEEHEQLGTAALADARRRSAGVHLAQAAVYYHFAKFMFVHDIPAMRAAHERAVACLTAALPFLDPPGRRIEVPFEGATLVGVLRTPAGPGPHPAVLMISGLDSAKEELRSTDQLLLDRGLATFSVDGPGQGEVEYALPIRPDWEVPGGALLDALCALPEIDEDRIGVWGVSLGGYYSPRVASGDARGRACIALAGPWNFGAGWEGLNELTRAAFRVRSGCSDDEQAHRRALELNLDGRAAMITCPLLVVAGRRDRIIPWQDAVRLTERAGGPTELLMLDEGNHGCMNVAQQHRPRSADWMARQLGVTDL
jgi:2,6-dihydroxypseudooxynicotine hydrolase